MEMHGQSHDFGGETSRHGSPDFMLIDKWLARDFFFRKLPRSADRYDFDVVGDLEGKTLEDGAATLCAFTALSVKHSLSQMGQMPDRVIVCGGGRHNKTIMTLLEIELACPVMPAEQVGWDADMIEAQAFAYLAVRTLRGLPISFPDTTGVNRPMTGGVVARPRKAREAHDK
jgi:anhydro-N-acetylmuramic acid kinase